VQQGLEQPVCNVARVFHSAAAADTPIDVGVGVHFALRQLARKFFREMEVVCRKLWIYFMHLGSERALFTLVEMGKFSQHIFFNLAIV
jgi:hypothetical protein